MALTEKQKDFLSKLGAAARDDMAKTGILASLTTAQGILESGWGQSGLAVNHNNFFGIKKGSGWAGEIALMPTKEWDGTKYIEIKAEFRKYPNMAASIADHSALFLRLDRYKALRGETDYKKACVAVKEAGYATSPTYTKSLTDLIELYNLTQYDKPVGKPTAPSPAASTQLNAEPSTVEKLNILMNGAGFASPEYWVNAVRDFKYFDAFVEKLWVKYEKGKR